jgi:hypothetical protein
MTDDHATPEALLEQALLVTKQILGMPFQSRRLELDKLKEQNEVLHALVIAKIKELRPATERRRPIAKKGDTMAKDSNKKNPTTLLHFAKDGRKMRTIQVTGLEYTQHMASGDLYFETLTGTKDVMKQFMELFKVSNDRVNLVIAHPCGRQTLFQAPIGIATIHSHSNDTMGNTQLHAVKMRFFKEVVTLNLSDEDEISLD